jgi:hypothetical protein
MANERIKLNDSVTEMFFKLSEGDLGALNVLMEAFKQSPTIDPDCRLKGFGILLMCDTLGLYGSRIWTLYKDVCGSDLVKFIAVIRGSQLGLCNVNAIGLDPEAILKAAQIRLPRFNGQQSTQASK